MTQFITRVELHDGNPSDYDDLHEAMESEGFWQTIKGESGKNYQLPTSEYLFVGPITIDEVYRKAYVATHSTRRAFGLVVTEANNISLHGLREA